MLLKIITVLSIISISVDGISAEHEPNHAVSSQSYHRDDVPLSYKYSSIHIYTTPYPELRQYHKQNNLQYHKIQFAPLGQNTTQYDKHKENNISKQEEQQTEYLREENRKDHLEPKFVAENLDVHNQNYRSYKPGHNVEVLQANRFHSHENPYHENVIIQKLNIPKPFWYTEKQVPVTPENDITTEQRPSVYPLMSWPNSQHNAYAFENLQSVHQAPSAKLNRLHLNVARTYGVAYAPEQAAMKQTDLIRSNIKKPPSYTQAIFLPQKFPVQQRTILHPVPETNENYPYIRRYRTLA